MLRRSTVVVRGFLGPRLNEEPGLVAQGLVTNDVAALDTPKAKPLYTCILNAQGRVLHDMFLYRQPGTQQILMMCSCCTAVELADGLPMLPVTGSDAALLADVDASSISELVKLLRRWVTVVGHASPTSNEPDLGGCGGCKASCPILIYLVLSFVNAHRYKLRAAVDIDDVSGEQQVWVRFGAQPQRQAAPSGQLAGEGPGGQSARDMQHVKNDINNENTCCLGEWVTDPRLPELGQRAILPGATPSLEGAQVIYGRQYRSWRIEHGVAEGNEMPAGMYAQMAGPASLALPEQSWLTTGQLMAKQI